MTDMFTYRKSYMIVCDRLYYIKISRIMAIKYYSPIILLLSVSGAQGLMLAHHEVNYPTRMSQNLTHWSTLIIYNNYIEIASLLTDGLSSLPAGLFDVVVLVGALSVGHVSYDVVRELCKSAKPRERIFFSFLFFFLGLTLSHLQFWSLIWHQCLLATGEFFDDTAPFPVLH